MTRMDFGIFLDLATDTTTVDGHIATYVPLVRLAEGAGFTSVWAGESYPGPAGAYQHVPSPMLVLAALSGSSSLAMGTAVTLLPAWEPLRLAYDTTVMDHITGGRFSLGVGLGNAAVWKQFGVDHATVGERTDEMIRALRALWAGEPGFEGTHVRAAGPIGPRPIQPGGPPIWVGGKIRRSSRRAAALGDGLLLGTHFGWGHCRQLIDWYTEALAEAGRPDAARMSLNRLLILAETPEQAWSDAAPYLGRLLRKYAAAKMIPGWQALAAAAPDDLDALKSAAADICLVGSPESVLPELERIAAAGVTQLQARPAPYGMPAELAARTIELAGQHLVPRFR